ncbi:MAG: Na(+)-translocating NADH-quinone reductase subunit C [OM182 bacterium MED-G24]|uniref:Na(+)-translocating NADH-quinone reductase subunit C n=1 Tax=OM182 bacterium MED-G24 TaxID=1986255 RepID=A0A2A5WL89_9GAMM|nr:MAG: Na(+)-translocating NADH-quinone reductase subunit C [OM182 bacterium MED-G24]
MAKNKDSMSNILVVALSVCFACSIVVSATAVLLKPQRIANKDADRNKNILQAAGLYKPGVTRGSDIDELFASFTLRMVDLQEKRVLDDAEVEQLGFDISRYDQRKASKNPDISKDLSTAEDIASISRRARYSVVYLLHDDAGQVDKVVVPVHGYGLWSIMYGFVSLQGDFNTVSGITFYEQGETAGLGGEVVNPVWRGSWVGKRIYGGDGDVALTVVKGRVDPTNTNAVHQIDGLSGATLTSRGVENLVGYWLGDEGFGPVLNQLQSGAI